MLQKDRQAQIQFAQYRYAVASSWPEGARKQATLAAIRLQLRSLGCPADTAPDRVQLARAA